MKVIKSLTLLVLILFTLALPSPTGLAQVKTYVVGTSGLTKPLNYFDDQKNLTGFEIELIKEIDHRLSDVQFKFEIADYPSLFAGLDSGKFDLVANNLGENPERRAKFLFSHLPYVLTHNVLITSTDSPDSLTLADMTGKTFGVVPASPNALFLEEWNRTNPDLAVQIKYADSDPSTLIREVYNGRIDATIYATTYLKDVEESFGIKLKAHPIENEEKIRIPGSYFVYQKGHEDLRHKMDQVIAEMREDGSLSDLSQRFFGEDLTHLPADLIQRNNQLEKDRQTSPTGQVEPKQDKQEELFSLTALYQAFGPVLQKLPLTLLMTLVAALIGLGLGFIMAIIKMKQIPILTPLTQAWVSFLRGTPLLVQLFLAYYGLPILIKIINQQFHLNWDIHQVPALLYAFLAMGLYTAAYNSETIRSALLSVNPSEMEAAHSIGLTKKQTLWRIIIPSAVIVAIPNLGNSLINLLKGTSLAFTITIVDMMGQAKILAGANLRYFESYIAVSIIYWGLCLILEWGLAKLEAYYQVDRPDPASK